MFRSAAWTLRQPRYRALAVAMVLVGFFCIAAGTFELHRFHEKRHDNHVLEANAHAIGVPLSGALVPLTGHGAAPGSAAIRFRAVTATGAYDLAGQTYLADTSDDNYLVVTPLRTSDGTLLVLRGSVGPTASGAPKRAPAPPAGTVQVRGRLRPADTGADHFGRDQVGSLNPGDQAERLHASVYQAGLELAAHQPGTAGLKTIGEPDLSNPTGGARQWQLFSYILQWYAFAALALLAPFLMSRHEVREAQKLYLGIDPGAGEWDLEQDEDLRALPAGSDGSAAAGTELAARAAGELARRGPSPERLERAARIADRYGRSLGPDFEKAARSPVRRRRIETERPTVTAEGQRSAATPHRSGEDEFHARYNDYLWQLALADGDLPAGTPTPGGAPEPGGEPAPPAPDEDHRAPRD